MQNPNDVQVGGTHYKKFKIEVWDFITVNNIPYLEGNAIKYIARWRDKGGVQDLEKAKHYIDKLLENHKRECIEHMSTKNPAWGSAVFNPNLGTLTTSDAGLVQGVYATLTPEERQHLARSMRDGART